MSEKKEDPQLDDEAGLYVIYLDFTHKHFANTIA
jgi:hypothetical protein